MNRKISSDSDISADSLEMNEDVKKNNIQKDNLQTILVPFYEKDILIKIPKEHKNVQPNKVRKTKNKSKEETASYLINNDKYRSKRHPSYLEAFRKNHPELQDEKKIESEVGSLYPEVGDTERSSFEEYTNNAINEFPNTESYNELFYEKLLNEHLCISSSLENIFNNDLDCRSNKSCNENDFKSISEVSRRQTRTYTRKSHPVPTLKLGGLGPDMEKIRPTLERARSLQRYSEKVRMDNKVKIYKKSTQKESERLTIIKDMKDAIIIKQEFTKTKHRDETEDEKSYLINKKVKEKKVLGQCNSGDGKNIKSTNTNIQKDQKTKSNHKEHILKVKKNVGKGIKKSDKKIENIKNIYGDNTICKSACKNKTMKTTERTDSPFDTRINFLVNIRGVPPHSNALQSLEEKHKLYQEKVKDYTTSLNNKK